LTGRLACEGGSPVRNTFLVFGNPSIEQPEIDEVVDSLRSGWVGTGPKVGQFEGMFRDYIGSKHAVAVSSCTAALHLSMIVAGLGPGDEVITTPMTFPATVNAIVHVGARPVFVDVDRHTMNIDPDAIPRALTPRTKAVVPVHFAGRPCQMEQMMALAAENGLLLIEDAAHCLEGAYRGRKIGTFGDATCFSFYVTKNITTIEGGMVTTDDEEWANLIKVFALHGLSKDAWGRYSGAGFEHYQVVVPGFKYNMTDVEAAVGIHQLERIDSCLRRRERLWAYYDEAFLGLPAFLPVPPEPGTVHARHLYTLLVDLDNITATRDDVLNALHAENIGCGVHYVGIHLHAYYRKTFNLSPEDFPNATFISDRTISIPLSPKLSEKDADDVVSGVHKVLTAYAR